MPYYNVKKIYKSVVEVEVYAPDVSTAQEVAVDRDGCETDCWLYDMEVVETKGEE